MLFLLSYIAVFSQQRIKPNVPFALYSFRSPEANGDSVLLRISLKNDSIQLSGYFGVRNITNFQQIDEYYCRSVKHANIIIENNFVLNYRLVVDIDSAVMFRRFDELLEKLNILGVSGVFLRTKSDRRNDGGFYIGISENPDIRQATVKELYGVQYSKKILDKECVFLDFREIFQESLADSEVMADPIDLYLMARKSNTDSNYYFIKSKDGKMMINDHQVNAYSLAEIIMKKNIMFFVETRADNTFYDLIRVMDVLYHAQKVAAQKSAIFLYNKTFEYLSEEEYENVMENCDLNFIILSLSDQLYLERNAH